MYLRLKIGAVLAWVVGVGFVISEAFAAAQWELLAGAGFFVMAGVLTMSVVTSCQQRRTRRAVYGQRRWDDQPERYSNVRKLHGA